MRPEAERARAALALAQADHPDTVPGGFATFYLSGADATPVGFAERLLGGWANPRRWRAVLTVEGHEVEVGGRGEHRCAEDAEIAVRHALRAFAGEGMDAFAGENVVWF